MVKKRVAIVTGASRGIGARVAQQLSQGDCIVYAGYRNLNEGGKSSANYFPIQLDVTSDEQIKTSLNEILEKHQRIDVLINNAGIYTDDIREMPHFGMLDLDPAVFIHTWEVNVLGPLRILWRVLPAMKETNYGRVVNVSSGMARFTDINNEGPFYRISKVALNALTLVVAAEVKNYNILVNSVCPGWVATNMGGSSAPRSLDEGAQGITDAACLPDDGPRGKFLRDGRILDWCSKDTGSSS